MIRRILLLFVGLGIAMAGNSRVLIPGGPGIGGNTEVKAAPEEPVEGMWLPLLLKQLNESDMQSLGLKLSAEDLYSVNKSSLKDAIVSFGGFCTGEIISKEGLLLTNHHCGFGQVQSHSTPENDYVTDGFWAATKADEIANPGLTATIIVRIEDVTGKVLKNVTPDMDEAARSSKINAAVTDIVNDAKAGTHYNAQVKPFFYGNEYYLFVTETFKDVRLVGTPPSAIGKFGGDTDNWMWPRHTGDFSIFRIYAGPDNKPAEYSENNVPYKPKHHLPISLKGVNKGDFTMVYGFPGRTSEYLTSYAVRHIMEDLNPRRIALRAAALEIVEATMAKDKTLFLKYVAKQARISNYWKKWRGENRGLKRLDAINVKLDQEKQFQQWADQNPTRKSKYGNLLPRFREIYTQMKDLSMAREYLNESAFRIEMVLYAFRYFPLVRSSQSESVSDERFKQALDRVKGATRNHFKDYDPATDQKMMATMLRMYAEDLPQSVHPEVLKTIKGKYKGDYERYAADVFKKSILASREKADAFLASYTKKQVKKLLKDPGYKLMDSFLDFYRKNIADPYDALNSEIGLLSRTYVAGLREMKKDRKFYPDANSTLRVAFGQVDDYEPKNGVKYHHYTTLDGVMEKYVPGDREFDLPESLIRTYKNKDFGRYAVNGTVPVCFTASNHTTGGNSGSPVINGYGHLIGTNFDRNWEGTMSDIMYDPDRCRNIAVDIRYILFVIDKVCDAGHLVDEMTLIE